MNARRPAEPQVTPIANGEDLLVQGTADVGAARLAVIAYLADELVCPSGGYYWPAEQPVLEAQRLRPARNRRWRKVPADDPDYRWMLWAGTGRGTFDGVYLIRNDRPAP